MAVYEIPLSPTPQKFAIQLGEQTYELRLQWNNAPTGGWVLDIFDENGEPLICGIPLVTGANLLEQFAYVGIVGELTVQTDFDINAVPTFENLGVNSHLFYISAT